MRESYARESYAGAIFKKPEEVAKENKCTVIFPNCHQIFLDIDSDEAFQLFKDRINRYDYFLGFAREFEVLQSRSGNCHVIVTFPNRTLTQEQQIAEQILLGSDPEREFLNWLRLKTTGDSLNCLFRPVEESQQEKKEECDKPWWSDT